jgi:hypothetical protein
MFGAGVIVALMPTAAHCCSTISAMAGELRLGSSEISTSMPFGYPASVRSSFAAYGSYASTSARSGS